MLPLLQRASILVLSVIVAWLLSNGYRTAAAQHLCNRMPNSVQHLLSCPKWNLLYHLGGNGPWIPKGDAILLENVTLPEGCVVDQVHLLSRHAERYPTKAAGERELRLLTRLKSSGKPFHGAFRFLNQWTYFANSSDEDFENLIRTGPYAGTTQAQRAGRKFRERYGFLQDKRKALNFWSCDSSRDIETAEYFADGFFGSPAWSTDGSGKLHVIPETEDRGGDTLTPGKTCKLNRWDEDSGRQRGYEAIGQWQEVFTKSIIERFSVDQPIFEFKPGDIYTMMEMCGFEVLVRGSSPWCGLFTQAEWGDFEYARDLLHYYRSGPGSSYAGAMGYLWLNATQELISNPTIGGLYFSFVHDGDILPLLATLGYGEGSGGDDSVSMLAADSGLPVDRVDADRTWRTSDIVPMGGRVVLERIDCRQSPFVHPFNQTLVRFSINDGVISLDKQHAQADQETSRHGMPLERFQGYVSSLAVKYGNFRGTCGLDEDVPAKITFLHQ